MSSFTDRLIELAPHYLAMIALMFGALVAIESVVGEMGFWPSLGVAVVVAIAYPFVLRRLGVAPEPWR